MYEALTDSGLRQDRQADRGMDASSIININKTLMQTRVCAFVCVQTLLAGVFDPRMGGFLKPKNVIRLKSSKVHISTLVCTNAMSASER